jgi:hypothetical protein
MWFQQKKNFQHYSSADRKPPTSQTNACTWMATADIEEKNGRKEGRKEEKKEGT